MKCIGFNGRFQSYNYITLTLFVELCAEFLLSCFVITYFYYLGSFPEWQSLLKNMFEGHRTVQNMMVKGCYWFRQNFSNFLQNYSDIQFECIGKPLSFVGRWALLELLSGALELDVAFWHSCAFSHFFFLFV